MESEIETDSESSQNWKPVKTSSKKPSYETQTITQYGL